MPVKMPDRVLQLAEQVDVRREGWRGNMHCLDRSILRPTKQKSADFCISLAPASWVVLSPLLIFVLAAFDGRVLDAERVQLCSQGGAR